MRKLVLFCLLLGSLTACGKSDSSVISTATQSVPQEAKITFRSKAASDRKAIQTAVQVIESFRPMPSDRHYFLVAYKILR